MIQNIQELKPGKGIVCGMAESNDASAFKDILAHPDYVTHYVARPKGFSSQVIVVLWSSHMFGPAMVHEGKCVLYVYSQAKPKHTFESWSPAPRTEKVFTNEEMTKAARVRAIIREYQSTLFQHHSNLVAIRSSRSEDGRFFIEFVVLAKDFVPIVDEEALPRVLDGVPTRVRTGIAMLCGREERAYHRPIVPGAGFAAGPEAHLDLKPSGGPYVAPLMGTIGGTYSDGEKIYAVACAHCIKPRGTKDMHPAGTPVYQPSALCLILDSISLKRRGEYERMRDYKGEHSAMTWLNNVEDIEAKAKLPPDAQFGTVRGGIFGPIPGSSYAVDCALLELTAEVSLKCN